MSSYKLTNTKKERNKVEAGVLYLVATPIGNLSDISERAIKVLTEVTFIAAEDTRNSIHMLTHLGIQKPLVSYHEYNKHERGEEIAARLQNGESCAIITDAGTPAISDPGADIVRLCAEKGITVSSIPGACAAITALTLSALPTGRFCFEGFLSYNKNERRTRLASLEKEDRTMIFYEAPHKLVRTLEDLQKTFGSDRKISLCRELTKLNEEVRRTTIGEALAFYGDNPPRGEFVLVVDGAKAQDPGEAEFTLTVKEQVDAYIEGGMDRMDAIKKVAKERGLAKNDVYKEVATKGSRGK